MACHLLPLRRRSRPWSRAALFSVTTLDERITPDSASVGTFDTSIIQPAGPRGDDRFFNIQGKNANTNASYAIADFDFAFAFTGPVGSFNAVTISLAHDDAAFSTTGTINMYITGDDTTGINKGSSSLIFDPLTNDGIVASDFTDRVFVGSFTFNKNATGGAIDTFPLDLSNPAASAFLANEINGAGGNSKVRLLFCPDNVGTPGVAATYGGETPRNNYQKPTLAVDANIGAPGAPRAKTTLTNVTTGGAISYPIVVTYTDDTAIKVSTIDGNDVRVTGPNGFNQLASFVSVDVNTDGTPRVATYSLAAPGGTFDPTDNGSYLVSLEAGQVTDTGGTAVADVTLGKFTVAIPNPQNFIVTNTNDTGAGSLRDAIALANANVGTDTITFDPTVFSAPQSIQPIGELLITDSVVVNGTKASNIFLDGTGGTRILRIDGPGTLDVTLNNLTFTNAFATTGSGGGIQCVGENLTVNNCVFTGNKTSSSGAAIAQTVGGTLTVQDSVLSTNTTTTTGGGGAINADSNTTVVIRRTTLSGNTAGGNGGAIAFFGANLTVEDSLLAQNTAKIVAGGGGGIYLSTTATSVTVRNSTITGNASSGDGGGIQLGGTFNGTALIQNSTIVFNSAATNGGGIGFFKGTNTVELRSTIVALNTNANGPDIWTTQAVKASNSLIGISDTGFTLTDEGGNKLGTLATPLDPQIEFFANNGGPTETHALKAGSPAINAGANPAGLSFDQRGTGFVRVSGGQADIGAYEVQFPAAPPTVTGVKVNDGSAQRSRVTSLTVTFSEAVTFPSGVGAAFQLNRTGPGTPTGAVNLSAVQSGSDVTLTFLSGGAVNVDPGSSLADGVYQLTIVANNVQGAGGKLDGDGNGTAGDDFLSPLTGPGRLHRLFGDVDGDGDVDAQDFGAFRAAFGGTSNLAFDFDGDGDVDAQDFGQFRSRFGSSV